MSKCPGLSENDNFLIASLENWLLHHVPSVIALLGTPINILLVIAIFKLQRQRHDVHQYLLIALLVADSLYLILRIVGISKTYLPTTVFRVPFIGDVLFHSFQKFAISLSTFMIVGTTLERFVVVHTPIRYVIISR